MSVLVVYIVIIYQVFTCSLGIFTPTVKTPNQQLKKKKGNFKRLTGLVYTVPPRRDHEQIHFASLCD